MKGASRKQNLTGRDIIVGQNGAGKTTLLQAIGLSLYGYIPGEGKTLDDTMKMASGNSLMVGIETDDLTVSRTFTTKDSKTTQKIDLFPLCSSRTIALKERRIAEVLGRCLVMMDFNEFIKLSDMKRREFLYALVGEACDTDSESDHAEMIKNILMEKQQSFNESTDPKRIETYNEVVEECAALFEGNAPIQEELETAIAYIKEQSQFWKKEHEKAVGAAQKISEYRNNLEATDRNLDANRARMMLLRDDEKKIAGEKATAETINAATVAKNSRLETLAKELTEITASINPYSAEKIRAEIAKYTGMLKTVDNRVDIEKLNTQLQKALVKMPTVEKEVEVRRDKWTQIKASKNIRYELLRKLTSQAGNCPLDKRIKCGNDFSGLINETRAEITRDSEQLAAIAASGESLKATLEVANKFVEETRAEIARLQKEEVDASRHNEGVRATLQTFEGKLKTAEGFESEKTAKINAKTEELNAMKPESGDAWPLIDLAPIVAMETENAASIRELVSTIEEQTKARNALLNQKNSMVDGVDAEHRLSSWKDVGEFLGPKGLQGELVKDVLDPLKAAIQLKLLHMGIDKKFFFQTMSGKGKEVFQFGWEHGGRRTLFDALSTGEQLLLLIAMMTTIVERLNPPLKILAIDNAECLDRGNYMRVIDGLTKAGENLDNIIICGVVENLNPADVPGWNVCDLSIT